MIKKDSVIKVKVSGIQSYGAFVKYKDYDGLIHISEFSENFVRNINDYVSVGEIVKTKVLEVDHETKQIKLSYKAVNVEDKKQMQLKNIPTLDIGFDSLEENLDGWIKEKLDSKENKNE